MVYCLLLYALYLFRPNDNNISLMEIIAVGIVAKSDEQH